MVEVLASPSPTSTILHHPPQPPLAVYYKECPSRGSPFRPNTTHTPWSARCTGAGSSAAYSRPGPTRSEEHTSELQSRRDLVCRLLLEKKKNSVRSQICSVEEFSLLCG